MAATDYFESLILNNALLKQPYIIENWYLGLWTLNPTRSGSMTGEVGATDYARKAITWDQDHSNLNEILWPPAEANWGNITYMALLSTPTKGQGPMLIYQSRTLLTVSIGTQLRIPPGGLTAAVL